MSPSVAAMPPPKMSPSASSWEVSGMAEGVMPGGGAALGSWGSTITWVTDGVRSKWIKSVHIRPGLTIKLQNCLNMLQLRKARNCLKTQSVWHVFTLCPGANCSGTCKHVDTMRFHCSIHAMVLTCAENNITLFYLNWGRAGCFSLAGLRGWWHWRYVVSRKYVCMTNSHYEEFDWLSANHHQ